MSERLASLLADLEQEVQELEPVAVAAVVTRLAAVMAMAGARLTVPSPATTNGRSDEADVIENVRDVARITRHSVSWVRKNGHTLPGFRQPGGKGTRVAWSREALEAWVAGDFR